MAKKEFLFRGKTITELKLMSISEFSELLPARQRRTIKRGMSDDHKKVLEKVKKVDNNLKTHARDMIILPSMVGSTIKIYNGKQYVQVVIQEEMLGHYLGEFSNSRSKVSHNAPGVGATRSSAAISVR
ncbi:MAG: 30S ribosomal protein S19 [Nanoarchaeota archaeon]|nr:30S ribosomal protein S19 [Nanoarchaeota archaeon]